MDQWQYLYQAEKEGEGKFVQAPLTLDLTLADHEVLVEPKRVSFCGTDLHVLRSYVGPGLALGHEWTGVVKALGKGVKTLHVGDVVTSATTLGCGQCEYCLEGEEQLCTQGERLGAGKRGAFCSLLKLPEDFLLRLKKDELDSGVVLEPLAVAYESLRLLKRQGFSPLGKKVLILGAGAIGLLEAWLMKKEGAQVTLFEIDQNRLALAQKIGFEAQRFEMGLLDQSLRAAFDVVIDAAGSSLPSKEAFRYLHFFGRKRFVALLVGKYKTELALPLPLVQTQQAHYLWQASLPRKSLEFCYQVHQADLSFLASVLLSESQPHPQINTAYLMAQNKSLAPRVVISI